MNAITAPTSNIETKPMLKSFGLCEVALLLEKAPEDDTEDESLYVIVNVADQTIGATGGMKVLL